MRKQLVTVVGLALTAVVAHAAPTKDPNDLAGAWTLDEGKSDDPVRVLRGERGRGGNRRVTMSGNSSIFGVPVGSMTGPKKEQDDEDKPEPSDLGGAEHVFEATYRLNIRREGNVIEIRYGTEPTIAYRDGTKHGRDGVVSTAEWQGGVLTVQHQLDDGSLVSERYWVDARTGELSWTAEATGRRIGGSFEVERVFYRSPANQQ